MKSPKGYEVFKKGQIKASHKVHKIGRPWEPAWGLIGQDIENCEDWEAARPILVKAKGWNVTFATRKQARLAAAMSFKEAVLKGPHKA